MKILSFPETHIDKLYITRILIFIIAKTHKQTNTTNKILENINSKHFYELLSKNTLQNTFSISEPQLDYYFEENELF